MALNQLRHLAFTADPATRQRFEGLSPRRLVKVTAALRPRPVEPVRYATLLAIRTLARRVAYLERESAELTRVVKPLIEAAAPGLLGVYGVGYDAAARLLVAAGDNPERLHSEAAWAHMCGTAPIEASSGKIVRHRLNRDGNRQANSALYRIVLSRMSNHPPTRAYVERRRAEGKSTGEIIRALKRYVAREVYDTSHTPSDTSALTRG